MFVRMRLGSSKSDIKICYQETLSHTEGPQSPRGVLSRAFWDYLLFDEDVIPPREGGEIVRFKIENGKYHQNL